MKKLLAATMATVIGMTCLTSCTSTVEPKVLSFMPEEKVLMEENPLYNETVKLLQFDYGDVTLLDGMFKDVYDGCMEYYDSLTADDILYTYRVKAGLDTRTGRDLGWMPSEGWGQCGLGQLISAKARRYAVTNDPDDLALVQEIVDGYLEIAAASNVCIGCESWFYDYDRRLRGFLDAYIYCQIEEAYDIAKAIVEFAIASPFYSDPMKKLGDDATQAEWYTLAEPFNIFIDLAEAKGESAEDLARYNEIAKTYEYTEFWNIFLNDENVFDYEPDKTVTSSEGFHAYSHITSFRSAIEFYKKTGNEDYLNMTVNFIDWLDESQRLSTGGYGIRVEQFFPKDVIIRDFDETHKTYETQCNSYALVSVNDMLMTYTADGNYGNWIEDCFYNMTIASLETREEGHSHYCSDLRTTGGTKFTEDWWNWACCAGSRPLVVLEYLRSIYFNDTQNLYVNLYTNSSIDFENKNGNKITLTQNSEFPIEDTVNFTVNTSQSEEFMIAFRIPEWISGKAVIIVNGEQIPYEESDGWFTVKRIWNDGDVIDVKLPMNLYYDTIESDESICQLYALSYGPIALAYDGSPRNMNYIAPYSSNPDKDFERVEGMLDFISKEYPDAVFKPYYSYGENETYTMYIRKYNYCSH